jgi:hypothetical protein
VRVAIRFRLLGYESKINRTLKGFHSADGDCGSLFNPFTLGVWLKRGQAHTLTVSR